MNTPTVSTVAKDVAERHKDSIGRIDPGLSAYAFENLAQVVQFADLMCQAGPMLPAHLRGQSALCMAVTMRATHWGFDPFALAMETYQVSGDSPIAYQAKVFVAALKSVAGIQLNFEFTGSYEMTNQAAQSSRGNTTAKRTADGDRACTAWIEFEGRRLEYTTPKLNDITIKNSPLWHNDPDQQLAYYAGRGWARRHRPDVMMGALSVDEVQDAPPEIRDVTPKQSGFAQMGMDARAEAEKELEGETVDGTAKEAAEDLKEKPQDTEREAERDALRRKDVAERGAVSRKDAPDTALTADEQMAFTKGQDAALEGFLRDQHPRELDGDQLDLWLAGFDSVEQEGTE
ncbi:MAG: recombinase RecT [Pseudomonadota bacterium]